MEGSKKFKGPILARALGIVLLMAATFPLPSFGECTNSTVTPFYLASWDRQGTINRTRIEESWVPDTFAGKGPYNDGYTGELRLSDHYLAFLIPPLTGPIVSAELRLQVRYLTSFRGIETYQCQEVTNSRVSLQVRRALGANLYESSGQGTVYGKGAISTADYYSSVGIPLGPEFITAVTAAAGKKFLMQGSMVSLNDDPFDQQYVYLNGAYLNLVFAKSGAPEISVQPVPRNVNAGATVDFHVMACGQPPLSYQWRFYGSDLPGATESSLVLRDVRPANIGLYGVVVSNSSGSVTSSAALLQVAQRTPYFAIQPEPHVIDAGRSNQYLRAVAGGSPPPSYQWRFNGANLPDATNNVLRFPLVTPELAGTYQVVASNSLGSATSNPAILQVIPFYLYGPSTDITALLGNQTSFSISVSGAVPPQSCQWFHNGSEITGETNFFLRFTATSDSAGDYFAIASNQYGAWTSTVARVVVMRQGPVFTGTPLADTTFIGGLPNALRAPASGGPPPVFYWYHDGVLIGDQHDSVLTFPRVGRADAGFYSVVASNELASATNGPAYVSISAGTLYAYPFNEIVGAGSAAHFSAQFTGAAESSFQWTFKGTALPGETRPTLTVLDVTASNEGAYSVVVSNEFGVLQATSQLTVSFVAPVIGSIARSTTARAGDYVWLRGDFGGAPPPACQWQFNGVNLPGATNYMLALSSVSAQDTGDYSAVLSNSSGVATSQTMRLDVVLPGPLDNWTSLNPSPQANPLRGVAAGNGRRIAVGENGAILLSTDNQTWTARHLGDGIHLSAVAFGNGLFVVAGHADSAGNDGPVLLTSADGEVWISRSLSVNGRIRGLAFGNGRFVAVGAWNKDYTAVALTSVDGNSWERHSLPGYSITVSSICFGNGLFVAASESGYSAEPRFFSSSDGLNWQGGYVSSYLPYEAICAGDGAFVAIAGPGAFARSSDGVNWTEGFSGNSGGNAIAFGNGTYVAAGYGGATYISSDGTVWQPILGPNGHDISALAFGDGQFIAVGDAGRILVSNNGLGWTDQCVGPDSDLYGIAVGPDSYVAVGDPAILNSLDGSNWVRSTATRKLHGITYGNGMYVAVGKKDLILTSTDGSNWISRFVTGNDYIERVLWANNKFVAVGEEGLIVTSADGTNWTRVPPITPGDLEGIAYGNGLWVAVGGYFDQNGAVASVLTSPDAVNWTDRPGSYYFGVRARGVTFGQGKFVLVGNDGLTAVSTNGVDWFVNWTVNENFRSVAAAASHFIAVGNDGAVLSSADGTSWTTNRCPASMNLRDIAVTSDAVLVVGSNGEVMRSGELRPAVFARRVSGGFELNVSGGLVPECRVQASGDLRSWTDLFIYTNTAPATYLDSNAASMPARFYRLVPR